jgi:hypothetical protein
VRSQKDDLCPWCAPEWDLVPVWLTYSTVEIISSVFPKTGSNGRMRPAIPAGTQPDGDALCIQSGELTDERWRRCSIPSLARPSRLVRHVA